jgi:penicillin-binding protein 2
MGRKMSERIARQPVPGNNLITTIDYRLQEICEKVLEKNAKRGAIAVIEVGTGEILALASWPTFNPNIFVPTISAADFAALQNNPSVPLYPRAFRSAYPPGSTFKIITGLAALQSGAITPEQRFNCPPSLQIGNFVFRNWKKESAGSLNFKEAMAQSCNTYFYQVGLKTGSRPIVEWAQRMGIGRRTGLPIEAESAGNMPTDEYMLRVHKRKILPGDLANLSIGQGDILITPLQMAQAMGILAARGSFFQTRLVKQIQSLDNRVIAAYPNRLRDQLPITPENLEAIRDALVAVTESGTGGRARVKGIKVAGKTGTAQWGPKERQRTAAWFAGFLPADEPKFAFAAVYEGDPNVKVGGGSHAAPLIGKTFAEYWPMVANLYAPQKNASPPSQKEENETSVDEEPPPELDESN